MAIEITEKFSVRAPIDTVWRFVQDPHKVVTCMPGAQLIEQVDETHYIGAVKVKLGAITTAYKGKMHFASVDEANHTIQLIGEGKEKGGGTAKGTVDIGLVSLDDGGTEMTTVAVVNLTGKVMQVGGPMIKGVSHQLFKQFAASASKQLEASAAGGTAEAAAPPPDADAALAVAPLVARTLWASLVDFFRRLFGASTR